MPNPNQPVPSFYEEEEITLKELILNIQEYFWEVVRKWWIAVLITIPIVLFMLYQAYTTPVVYPATLTFMLNEDEGGMNGISSILGQFGLGGASKGKVNLNKLIELSKSRRIIQMALFEKVSINDKNDYLANHIILQYDYHENWSKNEATQLEGFLFTHNNIPSFSRTENSVLKSLHGHIIGSPNRAGLSSISLNDDSGIMSLSAKTNQEKLSINLAEALYNNLSKFYIDKTIEKQKETYELFKTKTDSIQQALNNAQYRLLRFKDTNRALTLRQYEAEEIQLQQEVQKLILSYGEAYKNLEVADFSLKSAKPFIQVIDFPIPPIRSIKASKLKAIIIGLFTGAFLSILFIVSRKIIRNVLK